MRFVNFSEQKVDPIDKKFAEDILEGDPSKRFGAISSVPMASSNQECGIAQRVFFADL